MRELYNEIAKLRPEWHTNDDATGAMKIVMTGSAADPEEWQAHIRNKKGREDLAKRFKTPADPMKIVSSSYTLTPQTDFAHASTARFSWMACIAISDELLIL